MGISNAGLEAMVSHWKSILIVLWAGFCSGFYFWNNPVSPRELSLAWVKSVTIFYSGPEGLAAQALLLIMSLALLFLYGTLAYRFGRVMIEGFLAIDLTGLKMRAALFTGVGLGALSLLTFGAGLCGLLFPGYFYLFPALAVVLLARDARQNPWERFCRIRERLRQRIRSLWGASPGLVLLLTGAFLLIILMTSVPDTEYDALSYHLAAPKMWVQHHKVVNIPYHFTTFHPLLSQTLYGLGLGLDLPSVAKGFNLLYAFLLFLLMMEIGSRSSVRTGLLAAVLMFAIPLTAMTACRVYMDLHLVFWELLLFWMFYRNWMEEERPPSLRTVLLTGCCAGFVLSTKYTGAAAFGAVAAGMAITGLVRKFPLRQWAGGTAVFVLTALAVLSPWLIRNMVWTGNPVFPFLYPWFGGIPWTEASDRVLSAEYAQYNKGYASVWDVLKSPWEVAIHRRGSSDEAATSLWFLIFVPAALLAIRRLGKLLWFSLGAATLLFVVWFLTCQHVRFLLPAFPFFCFLAADAIQRMESGPLLSTPWRVGVWRAALFLMISGGLVLSWQNVGIGLGGPGGVCLGAEKPDAYLRRALTYHYYEAMDAAKRLTAEGDHVLLIADDRFFYLDRKNTSHSIYYPFLGELLEGCRTTGDIERRLRQFHADRVLYNRPFGYLIQRQYRLFDIPDDRLRLWAEFWRTRMETVWSGGRDWCLARVRSAGEGRTGGMPGLLFLPGGEEKYCAPAALLEDQRNWKEAMQEYERSAALTPDLVQPHERMAVVAIRSGDTARARQALATAVRLGSVDPGIHHARTYYLINDRRFRDALTAARRTIELAPDFAEGYYYLYLINRGLGRRLEAREALERAAQLDRANPLYRDSLRQWMEGK